MASTAFDSSLPQRQSSFTPPSSSPGLSPLRESTTSTTRQRRSVLVTMGHCNWRGKNGLRCPCTSGSCTSDLNATQAPCDNCMHPMSMHSDYASPSTLDPPSSYPPSSYPPSSYPPSSYPPSRRIKPYEHPAFYHPRAKLVDEIIARVQYYHIIRVRGTPASGKTTVMRLVVNKLLEKLGHEPPIFVLDGWDEKKVDAATGWIEYLRRETGVRGDDWPTYPAYLLLDEAQQSHWDDELWAALFKAIDRSSVRPFIILFASYGSPGRGFVGYDEKHIKTPMVFADGQQISLRPDENIEYNVPNTFPILRPVGLLLDEDEATDIATGLLSAIPPSAFLTADLKKEFFLISGGHVGLLASLIETLTRVPEIYNLMRHHIPLDSQTMSKHLFGKPQTLFKCLDGTPFTRGLPSLAIVQDSTTARVLKKAVADDIVSNSTFEIASEEFKVLQQIWRNGWLHAEMSESKREIRYIFATQLHRWYCSWLLKEIPSDNEINYDTPLKLAVDAIMQFRPRQLADAPRSFAGSMLPLEDQYQKEFYRCLFTILDGHIETSPEFVVKTGAKGGTIDFLVARKKWGVELLRNRDRLVEHMKRFEPGGQYFSMIQSGDMEQYIVMDFTIAQPTKPRPEYGGHLYHVVFSQNYRQVNVVDASDLSIVSSFVLMENGNPMA